MCFRLLQGTATQLLCVILVFEDSRVNIWVHFGTFCTRKCTLSPPISSSLSNLFSVEKLKTYELSRLTNGGCHQYFYSIGTEQGDILKLKMVRIECRARKVGKVRFQWQWCRTSLKSLPFGFPPLCDCLLYITKASFSHWKEWMLQSFP